VIERFAHARCRALGDEGLNDIGQVFEQAEKNHRRQVNPAVPQQQVDLTQFDRFIDDNPLHFKGYYPGKHHYNDDYHKQYLKLDIAGKYPGRQRSLNNRGLSFFHRKRPHPQGLERIFFFVKGL
jgi:hypothetical protein